MFHAFGFPFFFGGIVCYFLPTIIGAARHKTNLVGIFLVNFFLGWSVIGWVVALVMALSPDRVDQFRPQQTWTPQPAGPMPPPPPPPQTRAGRFCPNCGGEEPPGGKFCARCGAALP